VVGVDAAFVAGAEPSQGMEPGQGAFHNPAPPAQARSVPGAARLFIAQIRRKLEPDPAHPSYFITEPGMGYRFQPKDQPRAPDQPMPPDRS
jgi:hypothetical protein